MPDKNPGTYHRADELGSGDVIALGANQDAAEVFGQVLIRSEGEVLLALIVPRDVLFRLTTKEAADARGGG